MDGSQAAAPLLTIGDLAHGTGLPVRTIRYWSEAWMVPKAAWRVAGADFVIRPGHPVRVGGYPALIEILPAVVAA